MASATVVQFALLSVPAVLLIFLLIVYKTRKALPQPPSTSPQVKPVAEKILQRPPAKPMPLAAGSTESRESQRDTPPIVTTETAMANAVFATQALKPAPVVDLQGALISEKERNERILAGISENIRKSLETRPVSQYSPIPYTDSKPRNTEYVRVKKEIITPHGQIRFSILKDWMTVNMLAVFRRASLEWKTPEDLIAFLPAYLEPEAEILDGQVLLISTRGHNETLAVPIRSLDASSVLNGCFDFVTDVRATNTPAVLLLSNAGFDVVAKGVITKALFMNAIGDGPAPVRLLVERSPEAMRRMEPAIGRQGV